MRTWLSTELSRPQRLDVVQRKGGLPDVADAIANAAAYVSRATTLVLEGV
jgi:glycerate kinase